MKRLNSKIRLQNSISSTYIDNNINQSMTERKNSTNPIQRDNSFDCKVMELKSNLNLPNRISNKRSKQSNYSVRILPNLDELKDIPEVI